jgi:SNF2 family DNA or RNA helicase
MTVSAEEPFQVVYSLFQHEYLGYLWNVYAIQLDHHRRLTLKYQLISTSNAADFQLNDADLELVELIDSMQQEAVIKRFSHKQKKVKPEEFFERVYDEKNGDKVLQEEIYKSLEQKRAKVLEKLWSKNKLLFEMSNDGIPIHQRIDIEQEKAKVLFHFFRNTDNIHYFPTIKYKDQKIDFQYKKAVLLCNEPAWLLLEGKLYTFEKNVDGKKLQPFLNKRFIEIPKKLEDNYLKKFVAPLIEEFDVHAKGFDIKVLNKQPKTLLRFTEVIDTASNNNLFDNTATSIETESKVVFSLKFLYETYEFEADAFSACHVNLEKIGDNYIFYKIVRNQEYEKIKIKFLQEKGLDFKSSKLLLDKSEAFDWISHHFEDLTQQQIVLEQYAQDTKKYFVGKSHINLSFKENADWFDVHCLVRFGEYEIPFLQLRKAILQKKKEFVLPNGEIAVIPATWFTQYNDIFNYIEDKNGKPNLKKYHLALLQELQQNQYAEVLMGRKLEKLRDFENIEDYELPKGFIGELRPYQKAGYNWLRFLSEFNFGGCLADDMGLGKTVQTLALLQAQKETLQLQNAKQASLLILPTSLIYNWLKEAAKFTPQLKVLNYTSANRNKNHLMFDYYDLVITSYGIARIDIDVLEKYYFNYVILDEAQAIKNPDANITKAVNGLNGKYKLVLTGTPIENSTIDLWSQMNFVNNGLLGNLSFFKTEYQTPIEKKSDVDKLKKLHSIIKPFILRRLKVQVAKDLPEKIINIHYCEMTEEQEKKYEETKSQYRNKILEHIEKFGVAQSQMMLIQGLTQLRQIANHPRMTDANYSADSGKLQDILNMLQTALAEKHKVLIFSQFVKHLSIIRAELDAKNIRYTYLDGSTTDRQSQVEAFQQNDKVQVFLISLKAGGVGLNLTAADYVFLLDPWWNPAAEQQAIDRSHRIGQKNTVIVYKFITQNTVEEKILALQQNKLQLANDLITTEESFMKNLDKTDIEALLS